MSLAAFFTSFTGCITLLMIRTHKSTVNPTLTAARSSSRITTLTLTSFPSARRSFASFVDKSMTWLSVSLTSLNLGAYWLIYRARASSSFPCSRSFSTCSLTPFSSSYWISSSETFSAPLIYPVVSSSSCISISSTLCFVFSRYSSSSTKSSVDIRSVTFFPTDCRLAIIRRELSTLAKGSSYSFCDRSDMELIFIITVTMVIIYKNIIIANAATSFDPIFISSNLFFIFWHPFIRDIPLRCYYRVSFPLRSG